jgi:hypothetical protein
VLKTVYVMLDPLKPELPEAVQVEDVCAYLTTLWPRFPDNGHIYHKLIALDHEVTPHCEEDITRLQELEGPFFVVVYPGFNVVVAFIVAVVVAAATYFLTPRPPLPQEVPPAAARNQQAPSPNNELSQRENRPRINGRIPDIYGQVRSVPDLIAGTYSVFENNRELEYAYMCIGRGQFDIDDIRDGQTLISNIPGSTVEVYGPFTSPNSGDAPQLRIGNAIGSRVLNTKRSNSVNGQVLRPPNNATIVGNNNIVFVYPNLIRYNTIIGVTPFASQFAPGDELEITGATYAGVSGGTVAGPDYVGIAGSAGPPAGAGGLDLNYWSSAFDEGGFIWVYLPFGAAAVAPPGFAVGATFTLTQNVDATRGSQHVRSIRDYAH